MSLSKLQLSVLWVSYWWYETSRVTGSFLIFSCLRASVLFVCFLWETQRPVEHNQLPLISFPGRFEASNVVFFWWRNIVAQRICRFWSRPRFARLTVCLLFPGTATTRLFLLPCVRWETSWQEMTSRLRYSLCFFHRCCLAFSHWQH